MTTIVIYSYPHIVADEDEKLIEYDCKIEGHKDITKNYPINKIAPPDIDSLTAKTLTQINQNQHDKPVFTEPRGCL